MAWYEHINGITKEDWEEADRQMTRDIVARIEIDAAKERACKLLEPPATVGIDYQRQNYLYQLWVKYG